MRRASTQTLGPMTDAEVDALAADWVLYWQAPEDSVAREQLRYAGDREYDLVREEPEVAWRLILAVIRLDRSSEIQEVLSAGPLEDLLSKHGESFIGRVEQEAKANAAFARLLGGVWQNSMSESVWSRVQSVWDRSGWDGNT